MIISKEQIIEYFKSGIKEKKNFKIGIEHEKFLFDSKNNKRIDYSKIKETNIKITNIIKILWIFVKNMIKTLLIQITNLYRWTSLNHL